MPITTTGAGGLGAGGGGSAPTNSVAPVVSGTTNPGSTLTTTNGTWLNSPTQFDYQWFSGSTPVGLDQNTYVIQVSDGGNLIKCVVTASNAAGSGQATSNSVGPVTIVTPVNTVVPVVSGTTTVGSTLTTTNGTWTNSPTGFSYQWKSGGVNVGTNQNTYVPVLADVGNTILCVVTASNASGSGSANSNTVGPITNGGSGGGTPLGMLLSITTSSGGGGGSTGSPVGILFSVTKP